jgi:hypothetical protein
VPKFAGNFKFMLEKADFIRVLFEVGLQDFERVFLAVRLVFGFPHLRGLAGAN